MIRAQVVLFVALAGVLPGGAGRARPIAAPPLLPEARSATTDAVCDAAAKPAKLNFSLKDSDNAAVKASAFSGKVIVLNFWATWCLPCKAEIPDFVELQERYAGEGVQFLGVSVDDSRQALTEYSVKLKINYPLLQGRGHDEVLDAYGVANLPVTVTIRRDGRICRTHKIPMAKDALEREIKSLL